MKLSDMPDGYAFYKGGEDIPSWKLLAMKTYNQLVALLKALYASIEELQESERVGE